MRNILDKVRAAGSKSAGWFVSGGSKTIRISGRIAAPVGRLAKRVPVGRLWGFKFGRRLAKAVVVLVILLGLTQVVFAVLIYGFHQDNRAVRIAAKIMPFPSAVANADVITYKDYLSEKDYIHHFYAATKQEGVGYSDIDKQILDQLVENSLVDFHAKRQGINVSEADVDQSISQIVEQNGGQDKVEKVLNEYYGLNLQEFRRLVKNQLIRDKVNDQLIEKVTVRHILVQVAKDAPADQVDAAKKKADGFLVEIKGGLDFAEAAKKYSQDTGSAEQGGLLDPFSRGEMVKEFSDIAFTTPVGQVSEPVRSEFGWHVIKIESKTGKIDKSLSDWLVELKNNSLIWKFV